MIHNPFHFGEVATGENFTNRTEEIERLILALRGGHNIFLISPRRYGKTSLMVKVLQSLREEGFFTFYLDLFKVASMRELLEVYARGIAQACTTRAEKFSEIVKEIFPALRPKIIITGDNTPSLEVDLQFKGRELMDSIEQVLDTPERVARKRNRNFVIAFYEFQEIVNFNGERIEKLMRASFQHHHHVAYLFAGSKRHLIYTMISDPNRALDKMGDILNLQKIPADEMRDFMKKQFSKGKIT
ncbi:MAG: ATP-binding protein, partial [Deltaproteobacteria bacterium]|nr:ATP-binding protein [Deltaproteobacteria bacterium]